MKRIQKTASFKKRKNLYCYLWENLKSSKAGENMNPGHTMGKEFAS